MLACQPSTAAPGAGDVVKPMQQRTNVTNLYNDTCAKCHGVNGEGGGGGTQTLLTREQYDQKYDKPFFDAIKNGVPNTGMEPMGETMSDQVVWGLVVHVRELQGKALRAAEPNRKDLGKAYSSKHGQYRIETVVAEDQGLKTPWSMDWLPDGTLLVTSRAGWLSVIKDGKSVGKVENIPPSIELGQGGLLEVKVHPGYAKNGWVYLTLSDPKKDGSRSSITKVVRGKITKSGSDYVWTDQKTIFESPQEQYSGSSVHFGSKIVLDGKGHIFFSHGERGSGELAQDLSRPNGKIHRLNEDGSVPADNPFVNQAGALKSVWSYGHRNPQGLTMDLEGNLWDTEHGPRGGDEVNLIKPGGNYGWPLVAFSINYNDSPDWVPWPKPDQKITMPVFRWLPSIGASGMTTHNGVGNAAWKGDLFAGGLAGSNLDRFKMKGGKLVEHEEIFWGMGRIRDVQCGKDGAIYVALNQPDKIIRVVPIQ